jgi:hypothetical protein
MRSDAFVKPGYRFFTILRTLISVVPILFPIAGCRRLPCILRRLVPPGLHRIMLIVSGVGVAAALMTKGAPHFKAAVSVAPVIDLATYQAIGVERWMGFLEDNPQGYAEVNLINYADQLQGDLLLIHGSGDENVKFAFTLQFANALIAKNKQFDMMVYPNRHHVIRDAQLHVFTKISHYFFDKL